MMMKVNIDIDDTHTEPSITIQTNEWSEELEEIVAMIKRKNRKRLFGVESDQTVLLDPLDIDFEYAEKRRIFAAIGSRSVEIGRASCRERGEMRERGGERERRE